MVGAVRVVRVVVSGGDRGGESEGGGGDSLVGGGESEDGGDDVGVVKVMVGGGGRGGESEGGYRNKDGMGVDGKYNDGKICRYEK